MPYQSLYDFLVEHHDGKVAKASLDFYKDLDRYERFGAKSIVVMEYAIPGQPSYAQGNYLVAVSATGILWGTATDHSITVVHKQHRNEGLGSKVLKKKVKRCQDSHINFITTVKDENLPSISMCKGIGLPVEWRTADFRRRELGEDESDLTKFQINFASDDNDFDIEAHVKAH